MITSFTFLYNEVNGLWNNSEICNLKARVHFFLDSLESLWTCHLDTFYAFKNTMQYLEQTFMLIAGRIFVRFS